MEGGRTTEQDFDEFEMLLGEIPKTLGNPHSVHPISSDMDSEEKNEISSLSSKFTKSYNSSHPARNVGDMTFFGGDQEQRGNEKLDDVNNGYDACALNGEQNESNLPNDESLALALAFEGLRFKERIVPNLSNHSRVKYNQTSPNHGSLNNAWPSYGIDSTEMPVSLLHQSANGVNSDSQLNVDVPGYNGMVLKKPKLEILSSDLVNQQQSYPVFNGAMPLNPRGNAYQFIQNVPIPGIELRTAPYQQQFFMDAQAPNFMSPQHFGQSNISWHKLEEERYYRLQQQYLYQQQLHHHGSEAIQFQNNMNAAMKGLGEAPVQPYYDIPTDPYSHGKDNFVHNGYTQFNLSAVRNGIYPCHPHNSFGRVEGCDFSHRQRHFTSKNVLEHHVPNKVGKQYFPDKNLTRSHGVNLLRSNSLTSHQPTAFADNNMKHFSDCHRHHIHVMNNGSLKLDGKSSRSSSPDISDSKHASRSVQVKYNSLDEVIGRIYYLAKDQHGCRFLQRKFTEGDPEDVNKIFFEIIGHIVELLTDPFGNYLIQKMLEVCSEDQKMQIIRAITRETGMLIRISCNMHGTRAVQKVIETLRTAEQIYMVVSALKPGIVSLMKDINGNHVAQRCLQNFSPQQCECLFDAAISHCVDIATDCQGCCVLQKCVHHACGDQKNRLMSEISSYSLVLSQDPFGNYVVQYALDQKVPWVITAVLDQLEGHYGCLSMQKHCSNVVEKCLKLAEEEDRVKIIRELINCPQFLQILQDPYGNYVIQSALKQCKGDLNGALVEAIKPHVPALRSHPYGKKVLSCASLK